MANEDKKDFNAMLICRYCRKKCKKDTRVY